MAYPIGYAVTASITITAGAHSSQPSRRSSRAPSDARARRRRPGARVSWAVTGWVVVVIGMPLCTEARCSWRQPLAVEGVVDLRAQALLGGRRDDRGRRGDQVRDLHGHDLVERGLGPHGAVVDLLQDQVPERIGGLHLRVVVDAGQRRRQAALDR